MPASFEPIASTSPTTGSSVTFSSIPATYTDLIITGTIAATDVINPYIRFNSDSNSNYSATWVAGSGSATSSSRNSSATFIYVGAAASSNVFPVHTIHIMNYSNTTTNKTVLSRNSTAGGTTNQAVAAWAGLWRSTAAINSIELTISGQNFVSGTVLSLYGIRAGA